MRGLPERPRGDGAEFAWKRDHRFFVTQNYRKGGQKLNDY